MRSIYFSKHLPLDYTIVAEATKQDDFLQKVIAFMHHGWPVHVERRFVNVFANRHDLEMVDKCLLYQDRMVMQRDILKLLHTNHNGMVKMKQLARRAVYWFGINADIEKFVANCEVCGCMAVIPKQKITSKWTPTTRPFCRIYVDFFYFSSHTFLLLQLSDSFSRWLEVEWMKNGTDCPKVLTKLVAFFARFGLPDCLIFDGGPPFNSHSFVNFLEMQGMQVLKSPPYNPASNGQAERLVRTVKEMLKKFLVDPEVMDLGLEDQISLFLFNYRNTCLTGSDKYPSEKNLFF